MQLNVDLNSLFHNVEKMGAKPVDFDISLRPNELNPIDAQLSSSGIQVEFDDISFENGLANYEGRQVLIYIPDHSFNVQAVLDRESIGNKFHVSHCRTLKEMQAKGRYSRYIATNKLTGTFPIFGTDQFKTQKIEGNAELTVCKNCLTNLNYKGYKNNKTSIFKEFNIEEFFSTYSSFFPYSPLGFNEVSGYSNNWSEVSSSYKAKNNYTCEYCHVNLTKNKKLLHVHHINGVKSDNSEKNLRALCLDCHKKQPSHNHMHVKHEDTILINRIREEQGCCKIGSWEEIEKYADKGLWGFIDLCKKYKLRLAEVGYTIVLDNHKTAYLDLAWPSEKIAISLSQEHSTKAKQKGWQMWSMIESIEGFSNFAERIR